MILSLFLAFLVVSITPISAQLKGEIEVNNQTNMGTSLNSLTNSSNKINVTSTELSRHTENIKDSAEYLKDNWWKFWKWKKIKEHISTIKTETKQIETLTKEMEIEAQNINETFYTADQQVEQYNNSKNNAQLIADKLETYFKVSFTISQTNPDDLHNGEIIQLRTDSGNYVYLSFDRIDNSSGFAYFNGTDNKAISIPREKLPRMVKLKLTSNQPINSKEVINQAYIIQKANIDQKMQKANDMKDKSKKFKIIFTSLFYLDCLLISVSAILTILAGGMILSVVMIPYAPTLMYAIILMMGIGSLIAAASGIIAKVSNDLLKDANKLKNSAESELADLNFYHYHNGVVNHVPIAGDMSLNTTVNETLRCVFNATDADDDLAYTNLVSEPEHGNITINCTKFVYTPANNYVGNDTFTYTSVDKTDLISNTARVNIQVMNNQIINNSLNVTAQNLTRNITKNISLNIDILSNYHIFIVQMPLHGNATIENTVFDHPVIYYRPFKDYVGNDSLSYKLQSSEGKMSNIAWINITIKDWPL
jgi:hypothetical protein